MSFQGRAYFLSRAITDVTSAANTLNELLFGALKQSAG
jgi:hypothetical protein